MPMKKLKLIASYKGLKRIEFILVPVNVSLEKIKQDMENKFNTKEIILVQC